jgi:hypothetical protein
MDKNSECPYAHEITVMRNELMHNSGLMHHVQPREHATAVVVPYCIDDAAAGASVIDKRGGAPGKHV